MRILILNWRDPKNPKAGGAEIVTLEHARAWIAAGYKVTWLTSRFSKSKHEEIIDEIKVIRIGNAISIYLIAPFYYLLNRNKFDFIIDQVHGIPFYTPFYVRKPKIAFIHEVAADIWDYMYPFPINKIGRMLENIYFLFYKNMTIWTDAESTIEDFAEKGIPPENCHAIHCPASNAVINKNTIKAKKPTFICVSRVVRMKVVDDVIRAFAYIKKEIPDAQLKIVGGGDEQYIQELKELARQLSVDKNTEFTGMVSNADKLRLLGEAHIQMISIKVHAGWCLTVIEAASQGTPSVVYRTSGLRDSVKDKKTGIITKENTPKALADESIKLYRNTTLYKQFQTNGFAWASSLTWEKATKQSLQLIQKVTSQYHER